MAFEITIPTAPRHQARIRYHHNTDSGSSSSSVQAWPFRLILLSMSTSDDDGQEDNTVVIKHDACSDRRPVIKVELPRKVTWSTRASVREWEMRVVAEAKYTIIAMDTNVATLILDGKAF